MHIAFLQVVYFRFNIVRAVNDANFSAINLYGGAQEVPKHVGDCASVVFTCVRLHVRLVG